MPTTEKARAAKAERSERIYNESKKATAPPKPSYTTADGKTVNVQTNSPQVADIRNKPASYYNPNNRTQRIDMHVHQYGYTHPYNWYYQQPTYYVGGGYSSAYWWMMMEWDAERRARWLYNNQHNIEREAYERGMQDAQVARYVAEMETKGEKQNSNYVDPEFSDDPTKMYTQEHVEAIYNPTVKSGNSALWVLGGIAGFCLLLFLLWVLVFKIKWGS